MASTDPAGGARTAASYDELPYDTTPLYETQPEALAVAATLLGMSPPPVETCRVLELGCGTGHNLIPMAEEYPGGTFLGIDFSERQIALGRETVAAVGLANIELRTLDIGAVDESIGQFDYIICHGVYSWVPPPLQQKILEICQRQLAPQGVAYLSYNTYPGWHSRFVAREAMWYRARRARDAGEAIGQGRVFLDQLAQMTRVSSGAYHKTIDELAGWMRTQIDTYVYHEFLEDVNQPVYFHEFVDRLAAHGLRHLGEPRLARGMDVLTPENRAVLLGMSVDAVELEQYADFVLDRSFRRSLVAHSSAGMANAVPATIERLHLTTLARPASTAPNVASTTVEGFTEKTGVTLSTSDPLVKAALVAMYECWPMTLSFDALCQEVERRLAAIRGPLTPADRRQLAEHMLACYRSEFVSLHLGPFPFLTRISERPRASRLAQHQARATNEVTNLRHQQVKLPDFPRLVLMQLEGRLDEAAVVGMIEQAIADGRLPLDPQLQSATPDGRRSILTMRVRGSLDYLMRAALLHE